MFAFFKRKIQEKHKSSGNETTPDENTESMIISKKFREILQLSFETKKCEGGTLSKKKTRKFKALEDRMNNLFNDVVNSVDTEFDNIIVLAVAYYNVGLLYSGKDKLEAAINLFEKCTELLKGKELDCKAILTSISVLNELNLAWHKLQKNKNTYSILNSALEFYVKYTKEDNYPDPIYIGTVLGIKEKESDPKIILDNLHLTTLQEIGIQYYIQPKDKHEFVEYLYNLLKEQLSERIIEGKPFKEIECLDWALTFVDLSKYFMLHHRFMEARNHLTTADYVIHRFFEDRLEMMNQEEERKFENLFNSYGYICSYITKNWGNYGVLLLRYWMERFQQNEDKKSCEANNTKLEENSMEELTKFLMYSEEDSDHISDRITETLILNLTDAKSVFVKILRCLDSAKAYFTADSDIETYAKIIFDISRAYKYLAGFEQERDKLIKLHKRRIQYLEEASEKLHIVINVNIESGIYKRIWLEIVNSCSTVLDLICEETYSDNPLENMSEEVDQFARLVLKYINLYLNMV